MCDYSLVGLVDKLSKQYPRQTGDVSLLMLHLSTTITTVVPDTSHLQVKSLLDALSQYKQESRQRLTSKSLAE